MSLRSVCCLLLLFGTVAAGPAQVTAKNRGVATNRTGWDLPVTIFLSMADVAGS